MVCVGDVVCIGVVVVVFFGVGVEVVVGVFVFVIGVVGLVRFGVCVIGFGFVFTVVCGFFGLIIVCWRVGRVVDGRLAVCVFVVLRDVLLLRIGVIVAGLVGNVELIVILFSCCWFCGWVSVLFRLFCILIRCWLFVVIGVCFWVGVEEIGGREIFCWVFFVDVVFGVGCTLFVWSVVLLVRLIFFSLDAVWSLEVVEGVFSVESISMINSSRIRMSTFIIIYWREAGLLVVFLRLRGRRFTRFLFTVLFSDSLIFFSIFGFLLRFFCVRVGRRSLVLLSLILLKLICGSLRLVRLERLEDWRERLVRRSLGSGFSSFFGLNLFI